MDIHIFWEGPFRLNELKKVDNAEKDYGVYQIYGHHFLYGQHVLLYIGMAQVQTFCSRIKQESWENNSDFSNIEVYVGRLAGQKTIDENEWERRIEAAEKLLIYAHLPALNTQSTKTIPEAEVFSNHVLNWGVYRSLLPEVSGARYTSRFDHILEQNIFCYGKNVKA